MHDAQKTAGPARGALEPSSFWFGPYRLDVRARRLTRQDAVLPVSSKAFDILTVLVRRAGRTVTKNELMDLVWPGVFVDEVNLAQHVSALRKIFGDSTKTPSFIATIPRQGYQFVADVSVVAPSTEAARGVPDRHGRVRFAVAMLGLGAVTVALVVWLSGLSRSESAAIGSTNVQAVEAYTRGRHLIRQGSHEGLRPALAEFGVAVALDPGFAQAHAELANTYVSMFLARLVPHAEALERAQAAASTALALDPGLSDAHLAQGAVYLQLGGGFERAEPALRTAIELDPSNALAYDLLARGLRQEGRFDESVDAAREALALEPDSARYLALLARSLFFAGRDLDEARDLVRVALTLDRASTNAMELAADIDEASGHLDAAVDAWAEFEQQRGAAGLADGLGRDRDAVGAGQAIVRYREARLAMLDPENPAHGFERGRLLVRLGRIDEALDAFSHASASEYTIGVFGLLRHPAYRVLSGDPRFAELERAVSARLVAGRDSR